MKREGKAFLLSKQGSMHIHQDKPNKDGIVIDYHVAEGEIRHRFLLVFVYDHIVLTFPVRCTFDAAYLEWVVWVATYSATSCRIGHM